MATFEVFIDAGQALQLRFGWEQLDWSGETIYLVPCLVKRIGFDVYLRPVGEVEAGWRVVMIERREGGA